MLDPSHTYRHTRFTFDLKFHGPLLLCAGVVTRRAQPIQKKSHISSVMHRCERGVRNWFLHLAIFIRSGSGAWPVATHLGQARVSKTRFASLQQEAEMRMLGCSTMSTCPDGWTEGLMDSHVKTRTHRNVT